MDNTRFFERKLRNAIRHIFCTGRENLKIFLNAISSGVLENDRVEKLGIVDLIELFNLCSYVSKLRDQALSLFNRIKRFQDESGLWVDFSISRGFYKFLSDIGISISLTLDVLEGMLNLNLDKCLEFERGYRALLNLRSSTGLFKGVWRGIGGFGDLIFNFKFVRLFRDIVPSERVSSIFDEVRGLLSPVSFKHILKRVSILRLLLPDYVLAFDVNLEEAKNIFNEASDDFGIIKVVDSENHYITLKFICSLMCKFKDVEYIVLKEVQRVGKVKRKIIDVIRGLLGELEENFKSYIDSSLGKPGLLLEIFKLSLQSVFGTRFMDVYAFDVKLFTDFIDMFGNRIESFSDFCEYLMKFTLEYVSKTTKRFRELGEVLWLSAHGAKTYELLRACLKCFPHINDDVVDVFAFYLFIYNIFDDFKHFVSNYNCPCTYDLIRVLYRVGIVSEPLSKGSNFFKRIRREIYSLSRELFPENPLMLYYISKVASKWCFENPQCTKVTRRGLVRCPLYDICAWRGVS